MQPWRCYREQQIEILQHHGVTATALALHRLGRVNLADRFIGWEHANDPAGVMTWAGFGGFLEIVGLPTAEVKNDDDLDTLLNELFTVADDLDKDNT